MDLLVISQGVRREVAQIAPGASARGILSVPASDGAPTAATFVATLRRDGRSQVTSTTVKL